MYAGKLFEVIKFYLPEVHAYADDTQLYLLFQPNTEADQVEAVNVMERCIASIGNWMKLDKLKLNSDKTEIIVIGTKPQLQKIKFNHIKVGHVDVSVLVAWLQLTSIRSVSLYITICIISDTFESI